MQEQFELFKKEKEGEIQEQESQKKRKRKPGSKYYELITDEQKDEYAREILSGEKAIIKERGDREFEKFKKAGQEMSKEKEKQERS